MNWACINSRPFGYSLASQTAKAYGAYCGKLQVFLMGKYHSRQVVTAFKRWKKRIIDILVFTKHSMYDIWTIYTDLHRLHVPQSILDIFCNPVKHHGWSTYPPKVSLNKALLNPNSGVVRLRGGRLTSHNLRDSETSSTRRITSFSKWLITMVSGKSPK